MSQAVRTEQAARPHPSPLRRPRGRTVRRTIISALLVIIAMELVLRVVLGLGSPVVYQYDAACGYLPSPNQHVRRFGCRNDINSFSMRSPDIAPQKPPGMLRVLFVGDSVTYGTTHVDQSKIFTSLLAHDLPGRLQRPVEVLNASAGAWAVGNEAEYLESRGTFQSDVVVFVLNTGDLAQPFNHQRLTSVEGYPDHRPLSGLYELCTRYVGPRLIPALRPRPDMGSWASDAPDVAGILPQVLAALDEARDLAMRSRASFRIVYSPAHGGGWEHPAFAVGLRRLKDWARRTHTQLLDLTSPYAAAPSDEVYQDGIHLREKGNQLVASALETQWSWRPGGR